MMEADDSVVSADMQMVEAHDESNSKAGRVVPPSLTVSASGMGCVSCSVRKTFLHFVDDSTHCGSDSDSEENDIMSRRGGATVRSSSVPTARGERSDENRGALFKDRTNVWESNSGDDAVGAMNGMSTVLNCYDFDVIIAEDDHFHAICLRKLLEVSGVKPVQVHTVNSCEDVLTAYRACARHVGYVLFGRKLAGEIDVPECAQKLLHVAEEEGMFAPMIDRITRDGRTNSRHLFESVLTMPTNAPQLIARLQLAAMTPIKQIGRW